MKLNAIPAMLSLIPSVLTGVRPHDLEKIKAITRRAFPSVNQLGTDALAEWMRRQEPSLLLIDVRAPGEFAVSHLRGAVNLRSADKIAELSCKHAPCKTVLYCSVGFRSSRLAEALMQQGFADVLNLEGSIFQWANEGREVYKGAVRAGQVHPYGRRWAGLLKDGLAGYG